MPACDLVTLLQDELQAMRLAQDALESQLTNGAEQADAMLAQLEQQQRALVQAHDREQGLSSFAQRIMDTVGGLVLVLDAEGRLRRGNRQCTDHFAQIELGQGIDALLHPEDLAALNDALPPLPWPVHSVLFESVRRRGHYRVEHRLRLRDGRYRDVLIEAAMLYTAQGKEDGAVLSGTDITPLKERERELGLAASVFDNSLNAILIADAQGITRKVNRAFTRITGYTPEDIVGHPPGRMKSGQHTGQFYRDMWRSLRDLSHWEGEVINRHRDGHTLHIWESITAVRDDRGDIVYYIGIFSDITEQKAQAQRIHQLAYYDALTGLPNRALLQDRCEQAVSRARRARQRLAIVFMDLDRFKHINDSLGHPIGDGLLQAVAERLRGVLRESDTVARLGGDEFVVLLEAIEQSDDIRVALERIIEAFHDPFAVGGHTLSVSTTAGVSLFPDHGQDVQSLFKFADLALYRAKEAGRGNYRLFESEFDADAHHRMVLENELRHAIERGQLHLQYQPLYTLPELKLSGAEALLRWIHPELGFISPAEFIPVAEDSGLILSIGRWVLEEACRQAKAWLDAGHEFGFMAVNVAGLQIQRGTLVEDVKTVLSQTGLPAPHLELEISESYITRHPERDLAQMTALCDLQVSLAIDDFGTGQTSLGQLWRLPLSKLKIDRAFMLNVADDAAGATVTRSILGLAHNLGFIVVAEGVETQDQEDFLISHGCDLVQGFKYARPMRVPDFERLHWPDAD